MIRQTKWHKSLDYRNILLKLTWSMIAPEKKTVQVTEGTNLNNDWVAYTKSRTVEDCRLLWATVYHKEREQTIPTLSHWLRSVWIFKWPTKYIFNKNHFKCKWSLKTEYSMHGILDRWSFNNNNDNNNFIYIALISWTQGALQCKKGENEIIYISQAWNLSDLQSLYNRS